MILFDHKIRKLKLASLGLIIILVLSGCSSVQSSQSSSQAGITSESVSGSKTEASASSTANQSTGTQPAADLSSYKAEDLVTDYDSSATFIHGDGSDVTIEGSGAALVDGKVKITKAGTYVLSGEINTQILVEATANDLVYLVLNGVTITCEDSSAIYGSQSDKIVITLYENTENRVSDGSVYVYDNAADDEPNAVIFSKDDLVLNGTGSLVAEGNYEEGIRSKDDLLIISGTYQITSILDAVQGKDSVTIADGEFTIQAGNDAIKASNDTESDKGYVVINGGTFLISAGDDAFHAETSMTINGGDITITECFEGIEGLTVEINGGNISLYASDDGINAAGGSDEGEGFFGGGMFGGNENAVVTINGGTIYVNAAGDGIDSNGYLYVNGGTIYVEGATNSGNGALDYDLDALVSGGTIVAVGSTGMAQGFGSSSTQGHILYNLSSQQQGGSTIVLKDGDGNEIISFTPEKQYQSVVISDPQIQTDGVYTLTGGSETVEITMSGNSYSNTQGGFGGTGANQGGTQNGGQGGGPRR